MNFYMKLLFISSVYPHNYIEYFKYNANNLLQNASEVFQWAIIDGLEDNNFDFSIINLPSIPSFPFRYKKLFTPLDEVVYNNRILGIMLSYCDLIVYKTFSMKIRLYKYLREWIKNNCTNGEQLIILTYTPYPPYIKALKKIKKVYPNCIVTSIVTDLVDDMFNFSENRKFFKRIQAIIEIKETKRLYRHIDKFVLLTKKMVEKIPEAVGKNIIIEGIYSKSKCNEYNLNCKKDSKKVVFYSGSLDEFSGVKNLVDAFVLTKNQEFQLKICGSGALKEYIREKALLDDRISYLGQIKRSDVIKLQYESTVLINPRLPVYNITKYSFPSKTMEYLASGTPMIGYKLEGIPNEYYPYMFTVEKLSIEELAYKISEVLQFPQEVLDAKGLAARNFILENKTAKIQVKRIIDFIYN